MDDCCYLANIGCLDINVGSKTVKNTSCTSNQAYNASCWQVLTGLTSFKQVQIILRYSFGSTQQRQLPIGALRMTF